MNVAMESFCLAIEDWRKKNIIQSCRNDRTFAAIWPVKGHHPLLIVALHGSRLASKSAAMVMTCEFVADASAIKIRIARSPSILD